MRVQAWQTQLVQLTGVDRWPMTVHLHGSVCCKSDKTLKQNWFTISEQCDSTAIATFRGLTVIIRVTYIEFKLF